MVGRELPAQPCESGVLDLGDAAMTQEPLIHPSDGHGRRDPRDGRGRGGRGGAVVTQPLYLLLDDAAVERVARTLFGEHWRVFRSQVRVALQQAAGKQ